MSGRNRKKVKPGRGGHSGRGGRTPLQSTSSITCTKNNETLSKTDSSDSSGEEYSSEAESSTFKTARDISLQASLCSNDTTHKDSRSLINESTSSFKSDFTEWNGSIVESCTNEIRNLRQNEGKPNSKQFKDQLMDALYDNEIREALSQILLEPILNRVRELEVKNNKTDKKLKKMENENKSLMEKYSELEEKFNTLKTERAEKVNSDSLKPIETEITHIKHKANINMRMQDQDRRNNLVIVGIEEKISETQDDLDKNVKDILEKASIKLEGTFVANRLGKQAPADNASSADNATTGFISRWRGNKSQKTPQATMPRSRPVKICLTSQYDKHIIYKARTTMKDTDNKGIFINEDLPKIQQTLLMHCRKARRQNKIISQWTEDGVVHIRTKDKDDIIVTDLPALKKETDYIEDQNQQS